MIAAIARIFGDISLSWIDTSEEITNNKKLDKLLQYFPNLKEIFQHGKKLDKEEFTRTIRHIFRVFKIFFLMREGQFFHENLSQHSHQKISEKINHYYGINPLNIPLILVYHDIGRFFDRKNHPLKSYQLIIKKKLLDLYELSDMDKLLISKVIQYHLLFAAIYTGESTFYGTYSLLNDGKFIKLMSYENYINFFVDLLEIFTYIDILGYSYATIYDHYTKYYNEINEKLKDILKLWLHKEKALELAFNYSRDWLEWRIAGGLRIFQFIKTKPYLTRDFYINKLIESSKVISNELLKNLDWQGIKDELLIHSSKIQIKYGLGILMILAFGDIYRSRMKKEQKISYKLLLFWILLSNEVALRSKGNNSFLWNIYFTGQPHWSKWTKNNLQKLDEANIFSVIKNATQDTDKEKKEFNLYLDFKKIFN